MTIEPSSHPSHEPHHGHDAHRGHEPDLVSVRGVLTVGAVLAAVVIGSMYFLTFVRANLSQDEAAEHEARPTAWRRAEQPPVEFDQPAQLARLREWEAAVLQEYAWKDEEKATARIPVERAMALMLERGLPIGDAAPAPGETEVEPRRDPAATEESAGAVLPNTEPPAATEDPAKPAPTEEPPKTEELKKADEPSQTEAETEPTDEGAKPKP